MDWLVISQEETLSTAFIQEHAYHLHWHHILERYKLSPSFMDQVDHFISWSYYSKTFSFSSSVYDNYFLFFDIGQLRSNDSMSSKTVEEIENRYKNFWNQQNSLHISSKVTKEKKREKVLLIHSIPYTFPLLKRQEQVEVRYDIQKDFLVLRFFKKTYDEKKKKTTIALQKDSDMFMSSKEKRAFYYFINDFLLKRGKIKEHVTTTNALDLPF